MEVIYFERGKVLRMSGLIGPLQGVDGGGVLTSSFSAAGTSTKLDATYSVSGYSAAGMNAFAG